MYKLFILLLFTFSTYSVFSQNKMRSVEELITVSKSAWPEISEWIRLAKNKVEILPADTSKSKHSLWCTQVTIHSPMGAVIYMTGGILIDNGWIRILGSGNSKISRSLPDWNLGKSYDSFGQSPRFLLIADDIVGGFFAINGGDLGGDFGKIYYLSPESLKWEQLNITYTDFLLFCFNGDLNKFYSKLRWKNWQKENFSVDGDKAFNFFPTVWSREFISIEKCKKSLVPVKEQYDFNIQMRKELGFQKR